MVISNKAPIRFHESSNEFFAAIKYTEFETGFRAELIEKDYYCSVILAALYSLHDCPIIFKGGTMLTKVLGNFYRLSEDLDFVLPLTSTAKRTTRRNAIQPIKKLYTELSKAISGVRVGTPLQGSNESSQYNGEILYDSLVTHDVGRVRFEVSLREVTIYPPVFQQANTLLLNPFTGMSQVDHYPVKSLTRKEAYSEKVRAALCRAQPAIRDFYDIAYALKHNIIELNAEFAEAVKKKVALQIKTFNNMDKRKVALLDQQIETELFPTLRPEDYQAFSLQDVVSTLQTFVASYLK